MPVSYTHLVDNEEFHFAKVIEDYEGIYLTVSADDEKFVVETHDADGSLLDTYTKRSTNACASEGHSFLYDNEELVCEKCRYTRDVEGYTGWATDRASDRKMNFIDGKYQTGWYQIGSEVFYFNEDGLQEEIALKEDIPTDCTCLLYTSRT